MWARNLFTRTLTRHKISLSAYNSHCYQPFACARFYTVRMASTLPRLPIFEAIKNHDAQSTAVVHSLSGRSFTYGELVNDVAAAKDKLQRNCNGQGAEGQRISFLVENGYDYVGARSPRPCV
jgi:malonyl-CoA/methylmalonyl-CoA synthetase